jgi:hypothetical protein
MTLTEYELQKLKEIEDELHLNLDNLKIRLYSFKYHTDESVDVFSKYYLELEQYTLFWKYHLQSLFLIQPDLRLFYTCFFTPNLSEPINDQIRNFERQDECKQIVNFDKQLAKQSLFDKIPELFEFKDILI